MRVTGLRLRRANWLLVPLVVLSLALIACDDEDAPADQADVDLNEAAIGSTVTVTGDIDNFVSPRLFTIGGDEVLGLFDAGEALVLAPRSVNVPAGLRTGGEVKVTGQVVRVLAVDLQRDEFPEPFQDFQEPFNKAELDEIKEFDNEKAILAKTVTVTAAGSPAATAARTPTVTVTPASPTATATRTPTVTATP